MAASPKHNFQVVINSQPQPSGHGANSLRRPLSVEKALQYTPLTTSVLSACDRIPLPQIGRAKQTSRISTSAERKNTLRVLGPDTNHKVRERLSFLLNPDSLAEIKFKRNPLPPHDHQSRQTSDHGNPYHHLTPTARMVLEMADIEYLYPTPTSPSSQGSPGPRYRSQSHSLPTPAVSTSPESRAYNQMVVDQYSRNASSVHPTLSKAKFTIEIPQLPPAPLHDYAAAPDSPKRQKLDLHCIHDEVSLNVRAQKEVADAALQRFQNILLALFEAHDQLEPDSFSSAAQNSQYFDLPDDNDDIELRISTQFLEELQLSLKQLVTYKRLNDISPDHLRRLQRLCEPSVEAAQTINVRPESDACEEEVDQWRARISKVENGALSACIILWTILGNPHNPELIPEDIFGWTPNVLLNVFENCLIPVVQSRPELRPGEGRDPELFGFAVESKDKLRKLLDSGKKLLDLVATTCVQRKDTEGAINVVEFLAAKLIFVENGPTDKLSALGGQIYEKVRKVTMHVLAKIYARYPKERSAIMDEILSSLNKLPSTSRSARQYKLANGKNIQLVTALVMLLVQTTTLKTPEHNGSTKPALLVRVDRSAAISDDEDEGADELSAADQGSPKERISGSAFEQLRETVDQLYDEGAKSAKDITTYLVQKASIKGKPGKLGEDNSREITADYRNFLDFFVEDLLTVLSSPDWPASELLLRMLVLSMLELGRFDKSAHTKNMALEMLGEMGSTISSLRASVNTLIAAQSRDGQSDTSDALCKLAYDQSTGSLRTDELLGSSGPFKMTYQFLQSSNDKGLRADSARGFFLVQWAKFLCHSTSTAGIEEDRFDAELAALIKSLLEQISIAAPPLLIEQSGDQPSPTEGRLAYALTILNLGFCRSFGDIVKTLVASFNSDQAQVRSRSLKSVVAILENDATLLDRDASITEDIFACASDESAMVRDSALSLIAKFIATRPVLEEKGIRRLLECAADSKVGVQKRAIGHLKDIYIRDSRPALKAAIAETFLRRLSDSEDTVSDLALRTLTCIWITPYLSQSSVSESLAAKLDIQNLALTIVRTISQNPDESAPSVATFLASAVKQDSKSSSDIMTFCTRIVSELFDRTISDQEGSSGADKHAFLLTLKIFAETNPFAIGPDQLRALRPYLGNLVKADDLTFFKPVVAIFRCVLPNLSSTQKPLLQDIQGDLMKTIAKLKRRAELDEVMACLWTIDGVLHNTERLVALAGSVLLNLMGPKASADSGAQYVRILGAIGKQWDLENQLAAFRKKIANWKGASVASFMADLICASAGPDAPLSRRAVALESLGSVLQAWPMECNKPAIWNSFSNVFQEPVTDRVGQAGLQTVVLAAFADILSNTGTDKAASKEEDAGVEQAIGDMGGDEKSRQLAIVMGQIAQRYLPHILAAALARPDNKALVATKVITGINRQGLGHPKDCLGAMVALESGKDQTIANAAFTSHQMMHQQHASTYQRGYLEAVETAFRYHRDIYLDTFGCYRPGYNAKLSRCFETIGTSNTKYVKYFLEKLVEGATRDVSKLGSGEDCSDQVALARFILQNLAFFEYGKLDELLHLIFYMELEFSKKGAEVVQAIESATRKLVEIQPEHSSVDEASSHVYTAESRKLSHCSVNHLQMHKLAVPATILMMLWESRCFLKRQYGIGGDVQQALRKLKKDKDSADAALKVHGVTGDKYWDRCSFLVFSLENSDVSTARCEEFESLMAINDEIKVAADDDGARELYSASVELDESGLKPPGSGRGRKRKSTASAGGTPQKKKGRPSVNKARRFSTSSREDPDADFAG